jgi:hypothetical protein
MSHAKLFEEASQARCLHQLAAKGPLSNDLIAFLNHDGKLLSDMGITGVAVEDLGTATVQVKLLSALDPDYMENIATEGFRDFIKKYRKALMIAGIFLPFVFWAGFAGWVIKRKDDKVPCVTRKEFDTARAAYEKAAREFETLFNSIPHDFQKASWEKFSAQVGEMSKQDLEGELDTQPFAQSGWNESNFNSAVDYLDAQVKHCEEAQKKLAAKLAGVERYSADPRADKAVLALISRATGSQSGLFGEVSKQLKRLLRIGKAVSRHFSPKKDK